MISFKKIALISLLSFSSVCVSAFEEGVDYVKLTAPIENSNDTLAKVFSYDCPFCFKYDIGVDPRILPRVEKELHLKFKPMHIETKGKYGRVASEFLAMAVLRDQKAGVSLESSKSLFKKAKDAIYMAYHKKGERWSSGEDAFIKTMTDATGIPLDEFNSARKDPAVLTLCDEWKKTYDVAKIQGIPAYVVNGKYLIMTKNIRGLDPMFELIKELNSKE